MPHDGASQLADSSSTQYKTLNSALGAIDSARSSLQAAPGTEQDSLEDSEAPATAAPDGADAPSADLSGVQKSVSDSALDEVKASLVEMQANGWRVEGRTKITGTPKSSAVDYHGTQAVRMSVCLDSSDVRVVDGSGHQVSPSRGTKKALNLYTLVQRDGQWRVVDHSFPSDPSC